MKDGKICVFMNGAVGEDEFGEPLRQRLKEKGINVAGVVTLKGERTRQVVVVVEQNTFQSSSLGFRGPNLKFQPRDDRIECLAGDTGENPDLLIMHCTLTLETVEQMLETASRNVVETALNFSPAAYLESGACPHVTHLIFYEHEASEMFGRTAKDLEDLEFAKKVTEEFVQFGVKNVVITLGAVGACYTTLEGESGFVPAEKNVSVKDTTGAGYVSFPFLLQPDVYGANAGGNPQGFVLWSICSGLPLAEAKRRVEHQESNFFRE